MTPRTLLAAIGATAVGFALVISTLATSGVNGAANDAIAASERTAVQTFAVSAAEAETAAISRFVSWNDPCVVAF